jgi:predicted DNA-binding protein
MSTKKLELFSAEEITVTLPKSYIQRLHNLLRDNSQTTGKAVNLQERVERMLQNPEDRDILAYLDWILKQND